VSQVSFSAPPLQQLHEYCCDDISIAKRLRSEKVRLLYDSLWQPVLLGLLAAILLVVAMGPVVPARVRFSWLGALAAISLGRLVLAHYYHRATAEDQQRDCWLRRFAIGVIAGGCTWGLGCIVLFTADSLEQLAVLSIIMTGMIAGSVTTLSAISWVAMAFTTPIVLPLLFQFFVTGTPHSILLGLLLVLYSGLIFLTSRRFSATIHDNIALRVSMASREVRLLESENRYRSIFENSPLGVLHYSCDGEIIDCNAKMLDILGASRDAIIGYNMLHPAADAAVAKAVRDALHHGSGEYEGTYKLPKASVGTPLRAFFNVVHSACNKQIGGIAIVEDFTERKRQDAIIYRQAYYDSLTHLPNRRMFIERIENLWGKMCGVTRRGMLVFLDLDRFKLINDSLGHAAGDDLLVQVSRRLESTIHKGDMVARLSGDEFVLLALFDDADDSEMEAQAAAYVREVQRVLAAPYRLESRSVDVTPSIGYTCIDTRQGSCAEALRQADVAMYRAKTAGRDRMCRYHPDMKNDFQAAADLQTTPDTQGSIRPCAERSIHE